MSSFIEKGFTENRRLMYSTQKNISFNILDKTMPVTWCFKRVADERTAIEDVTGKSRILIWNF